MTWQGRGFVYCVIESVKAPTLLIILTCTNMDLSIDNSARFLHACLSGEFSLEEAERTFMDILKAIDRYQAMKVLVDGRAITGEPMTMERFFYGQFVAEAVIAWSQTQNRRMPRFAYVLVKPVLDDQRFGNLVATNRGMTVKTFDNVGDAVEWLTV